MTSFYIGRTQYCTTNLVICRWENLYSVCSPGNPPFFWLFWWKKKLKNEWFSYNPVVLSYEMNISFLTEKWPYSQFEESQICGSVVKNGVNVVFSMSHLLGIADFLKVFESDFVYLFLIRFLTKESKILDLPGPFSVTIGGSSIFEVSTSSTGSNWTWD